MPGSGVWNLERDLAIYETQFGPDHAMVVATLLELAGAVAAAREEGREVMLLEKALAAQIRMGLDEAGTLRSLSQALHRMGNSTERYLEITSKMTKPVTEPVWYAL